ncbi:hypothetical protein Tsubulata_018650 [Turnera subulata]|uniref:DUF4283 domain-containing protein n=1 Tax=Turnera subulata TaxID=218843 RepID=A0A9Q0J2S5_9ROSI|nr:hypothetical protein Tsubulata_018650 [Turnera subulata]
MKKVRLKENEVSLPIDTEELPTDNGNNSTPLSQSVQDTDMVETRSSYLDKLTGGGSDSTPVDPWVDEIKADYEEGDVVIVEKNGEKVVELSDAFKARLRKPWERTVVVKLMGRAIGFHTLYSKLLTLWQPKGTLKLIDLENNYFAVQFWEEEDYFKALLEGPWTIFTHVLSVQPWTPAFQASAKSIDNVVTWVRFLDFQLDCYHSKILRTMGNLVGRTVKLERNSKNPSRGKFAKVAVNVNITQPLKGTVTMENETYKVVYEGLPGICDNCGRVGHLSELYPERSPLSPPFSPINQPLQPRNILPYTQYWCLSLAHTRFSPEESATRRLDECYSEKPQTTQEADGWSADNTDLEDGATLQ